MPATARRSLKLAVAAVGLVVAAAAWYAFRPELLFITKTVDERLPASTATASAAPVARARGTFRGLAHATSGTATIYRLPDGKHLLRLTDFETSNGPDVRVYLVAAPDAKDDATVTKAGFVDLGSMKGNKGDQNYEVPAGVDLERHRAVSIWCARFSVNFGAAALTPVDQQEPSR